MSKENSKATEEARKEFKITFPEHDPFDGILTTKFISSNLFCKKVSDLFKAVYSDCEGCKYEVNQQGIGHIVLYFNHGEQVVNGKFNAITRTIPEKNGNAVNETVRRIRMNDTRNRAGDRYYLTNEGMEGLDDFIYDAMIDRKNNKVAWDKIVAEVGARQAMFNQHPIVYTCISMLDPAKLAAAIYGSTDDEGNILAYAVDVMRSIPQMVSVGNFQAQYMLSIKCVSDKEVCNLCNQLGIAPSQGLDIIK